MKAIVGRHFDDLKKLAADGRLYMAGRTLNADASTFGIAVFGAESRAAADAVPAQDPAVVQGVMTGDVYPFRVAIWAGDPLA